MPEVYDPTRGVGRRRRKRKASPAAARTVRAVSGGGDHSVPPSFSRIPPLLPAPKRTILRKEPKHRPTTTTTTKSILVHKDPFEFNEKSPPGKSTTNINGTSSLEQQRHNNDTATSAMTPPIKSVAAAVTEWKHDRQQKYPSSYLVESQRFVRHAVALDTRFLDTQEGRAEYDNFAQGVTWFLRSCSSRGIIPSTMAWKGYDSSPTAGGAADGTTTIVRSEKVSEETLESAMSKALSGIPILDDRGSNGHETGICVPEELFATASWRLIADLVQSSIDYDENDVKDPLSLTFLTSDITFFLNEGEEAHRRGLEVFMKKTEPLFLKGKLQTIRIAVATGTTISIDATRFDKWATSSKQESVDTDGDELFSNRALRISSLLKTMQRQVENAVEETFKKNRSQIQFDSKLVPRMDIRLFAIDSKAGFHQLLQMHCRDTVTAFPYSWNQTLHLSLPETIDFDACVVAMQASYKIMPFRLDSALAMSLYRDLEMISRSELKVLQLTPTESIDASLLYGVPISIRSSLAESTDRHRENLMILQSMLKTLAGKDSSLLLSATLPEGDRDDANQNNLFQDVALQHYYLLIPELLGSKAGQPTYNGVLFRMARADLILDRSATHDAQKSMHSLDLVDTQTNEYEEYVESSLESLACSPLNPLTLYPSAETGTSHACILSERKKVTWKEDCVQMQTYPGKVDEKALFLPPTNDPAEDEVWKDDAGIGLIMSEQKRGAEASPKKIEQKNESMDKNISSSMPDSGAVTNSSAKESAVNPGRTSHHDEGKEDENCYAAMEGEDAHRELQTDDMHEEGNGSDNDDSNPHEEDSGDDIEDSDDETVSMDGVETHKRKPTEIIQADFHVKANSSGDGEREWTQEDENEKDLDENDDDSSTSYSSSSSSSAESTEKQSPIGKFEYS